MTRYFRSLESRAKSIGMYLNKDVGGFGTSFRLGRKTSMGGYEFLFKTLELVEAEIEKRESLFLKRNVGK